MMSASQCQSVLVGKGREIVGMRRFHYKSNERTAFVAWSKNTCPWQFVEAIKCILRQLRVMFKDRRAPDSIQIINRGGKTDRAGDIWRPGFESMRPLLKRALFQSNAYDHFAAALP